MAKLGIFLLVLLSFTVSQIGRASFVSSKQASLASLVFDKSMDKNLTETESESESENGNEENGSLNDSEEFADAILRIPDRLTIYQWISTNSLTNVEALESVGKPSIHRPPEQLL